MHEITEEILGEMEGSVCALNGFCSDIEKGCPMSN